MDVISTAGLMILISLRVVFTDALSNRRLNNAMVQIHNHSLLSCEFFLAIKNIQIIQLKIILDIFQQLVHL